jgi:hypothetical protein
LLGALLASFMLYRYATRSSPNALFGVVAGGLVAIAVVIWRGSDVSGAQSDDSEDSFFGDVAAGTNPPKLKSARRPLSK